jgi:hypothetical protein
MASAASAARTSARTPLSGSTRGGSQKPMKWLRFKDMGAAEESVRLPSFREPPLEEVALAVQFQPNAIDLVSAARIAEAVRDRLPRREEQPGRPPMSEDFAPPTESSPFHASGLLARMARVSSNCSRTFSPITGGVRPKASPSPSPIRATAVSALTSLRTSKRSTASLRQMARASRQIGARRHTSTTWEPRHRTNRVHNSAN